MKKVIVSACLGLLLFACGAEKKPATEQVVKETASEAKPGKKEEPDTAKAALPATIPQETQLTDAEKIKKVRARAETTAPIEVISFYEEQNGEYLLYDFAFKVLADSSDLHNAYLERLEFVPERELDYSGYETEETLNQTPDSIRQNLSDQFSGLLTQWIPIHYYQKELVFYNPGDFNGGYYLLTDSLIFDNSMMDGPYLYKYLQVDRIQDNIVEISFSEIRSEDRYAIRFYFLSDDLAIIEHENKYLGNETGFVLATPVGNIYHHPLVATAATEIPEGVAMDPINYDSLLSLRQFRN